MEWDHFFLSCKKCIRLAPVMSPLLFISSQQYKYIHVYILLESFFLLHIYPFLYPAARTRVINTLKTFLSLRFSGGGGRGVRPVYLRCSRGTVFWRYPRGALRIVLSPPVLTGTVSKVRPFDLLGRRDNNDVGNSTDDGNSNVSRVSGFRACTKVSGPVRVYLEAQGKLRSVYSPRDGKHEASHRCFIAKKQPAALYVEAEESFVVSGERQRAKLQYDLEVRYVRDRDGKSRRFNDEEEEDCRPCSMDELAKAYCQSDLVARGTVSAVQKQPNLEAAELVLRITKTLRQIEETEVTYPSLFPRLCILLFLYRSNASDTLNICYTLP